MTDLVRVSDHIQAVVDHLNDGQLVDPTTDETVMFGRGVQPDGTGWQGAASQSPFHPYGIVWRIGSKDAVNRNLDDTLATEGRLLVFVRVFGGFSTQADDVLDLMHARMLSGLTVPGRDVLWVRLDNGQTSTKNEDVEFTLYEAGNFYRIRSRPSDA